MFKKLRVLILLYILFMVAVGGWLAKSRTTSWEKTLNVVVYAINGDGRAATQQYIDDIESADFEHIEEFFQREGEKYNLGLSEPVDVSFAGELKENPPLPPRNGSSLSVMLWSLKLRYWAWKVDNYPYPDDIQVFVRYFDPKKTTRVAHSLGLQKGLIGVVNAFATERMKKENHVVIVHELLHTVGATDKYDNNTNQPLFPVGYAEPGKEPTLPQMKAEVMAGRIPISQTESEQPENLGKVVVGKPTAIEINWLKLPN